MRGLSGSRAPLNLYPGSPMKWMRSPHNCEKSGRAWLMIAFFGPNNRGSKTTVIISYGVLFFRQAMSHRTDVLVQRRSSSHALRNNLAIGTALGSDNPA